MFDILTDELATINSIKTADENYSQFLTNIKTLRKRNEMNQEQLAKMLGVTQSFICRQEKGIHPFNIKQCRILHNLINMDNLFISQNSSTNFLLNQRVKTELNKDMVFKIFQNMIKYFNGIENIPFENLDDNQESERAILISILKQWEIIGPGFSKFTYFKKALTTPIKSYVTTLGIRSQRLRYIELGVSNSDSKLLFYFYNNCHCRPSFFLDDDPVPITIYSLLWQLLSKDTREFFINNMQDSISYEKYSSCSSFIKD